MDREELLKDYILSKYKSIRSFSEAANIPYMTVMNILSRGIGNSSANRVIDITKFLNIDFEDLYDGKITEKEDLRTVGAAKIKNEQDKLLTQFNKLNEEGQQKAIDNVTDLTQIPKYTEKMVRMVPAAYSGNAEEWNVPLENLQRVNAGIKAMAAMQKEMREAEEKRKGKKKK